MNKLSDLNQNLIYFKLESCNNSAKIRKIRQKLHILSFKQEFRIQDITGKLLQKLRWNFPVLGSKVASLRYPYAQLKAGE